MAPTCLCFAIVVLSLEESTDYFVFLYVEFPKQKDQAKGDESGISKKKEERLSLCNSSHIPPPAPAMCRNFSAFQ